MVHDADRESAVKAEEAELLSSSLLDEDEVEADVEDVQSVDSIDQSPWRRPIAGGTSTPRS